MPSSSTQSVYSLRQPLHHTKYHLTCPWLLHWYPSERRVPSAWEPALHWDIGIWQFFLSKHLQKPLLCLYFYFHRALMPLGNYMTWSLIVFSYLGFKEWKHHIEKFSRNCYVRVHNATYFQGQAPQIGWILESSLCKEGNLQAGKSTSFLPPKISEKGNI